MRDDLADIELADKVFAPHYAVAQTRLIAADAVLRTHPKNDALALATMPSGTAIAVFDISGGWAWGRSDAIMGYVPAEALMPS